MNRERLEAIDHLIGVAVSFPRAPKETDPSSWISVDLNRAKPVLAVPEDEELDPYEDVEASHDDVDLGAETV